MATVRGGDAVPPFLELAAHPVRWRLLAELAQSDRQVAELTQAVGEPQALVSYHLGRLRSGGLVSAHRSSFDGRASYYRVHLDRCGALLGEAGSSLHPALTPLLRSGPDARRARPSGTASVLFVCTGNGTRSQIAEAVLRAMVGGAIEVASAGSHPKPVHPAAVAVLAERGVDITDARSKAISDLADRRFTHVVTLCDKVREVCPEIPGQRRTMHWSIEDPGAVGGSVRSLMPGFRAVADDLESRITHLIALIDSEAETIDRPDRARSARRTKETNHVR